MEGDLALWEEWLLTTGFMPLALCFPVSTTAVRVIPSINDLHAPLLSELSKPTVNYVAFIFSP